MLTGAAVCCWSGRRGRASTFASPVVALVPLLFGLLLIAQTFVLPVSQPSMNWLGGGYLLAAFMATHAGYAFSRVKLTETALRWAAAALIVGGLFAVFCQVIQLFHLETKVTPLVVAYNITVDRRPFGNMAQANHLATYIAFAMAGALFLVQTRRLAGDRLGAAVGDLFDGARADRVARSVAADGRDRGGRFLDGVRGDRAVTRLCAAAIANG